MVTPEPIPAVVPVHAKDLGGLALCLQAVRANLEEIATIHVVGARDLEDRVREIAREARVTDVRFVAERDHFDAPDGWFLQQQIKLEAARFLDAGEYLVLDADTVFLQPTRLRDEHGRALCFTDLPRARFRDHRKACHCLRYLPSTHHLFGLPHRAHARCQIAHHAIFDVDLLERMLAPVRARGLCEALLRAHRSGASFSEFDSYGAFVEHRAPARRIVRDDAWADVPWPLEMSARERDAYLDRLRGAGLAFVSAHAYLHGHLSYAAALDFAAWLGARVDQPELRAGRWPLQTWGRGQRSASAQLLRLIDWTLDGRVRQLASYCFLDPQGEVRRSAELYTDDALARLAGELRATRVFVDAWAARETDPELARLRDALRRCDGALESGSALAELPSCARAILTAWADVQSRDGGPRLRAPLASFEAPALTAIVSLLAEGHSDVARLHATLTEAGVSLG